MLNNSFIKKYLFPIIAIILMALAVLLGLAQRKNNPESTESFFRKNSGNSSLEDYYNTAQTLMPKENRGQATLMAVGDIMLSRNVAGKIEKAGDPLLPFKNLGMVLASTDFNFGNLESPFSGLNSHGAFGSLIFNAPTKNIQGLKAHNFKMLNLANNHSLDQGTAGLEYTQKYLTENNIAYVGTGKNIHEAWQGKIVDIKGIKIGFIGASYASANDGGKTRNNYVTRIEDTENLKLSVSDLKLKSDFIVVTMHAGQEYTRKPNLAQIAFAHAAIDAGADLVIGAHPHWVQTIEKYKNKYVFYSLGNFIFDQEWSKETKEGLALKIQISKARIPSSLQGPREPAQLKQIELIPVIIENYCCPRVANKEEKTKILQAINIAESVLH